MGWMMANNDDFDELDDLGGGDAAVAKGDDVGDVAAKADPKAAFKDLWDHNPFVKIAAVVVGAAIFFAVYSYFLGGGEDKSGQRSIITSENAGGASVTPGSEDVDPVYKTAVQEKNQQEVELAEMTGGSAIPTPIGNSSAGQIEVFDPSKKDVDPLAEWRRAAEANRFSASQKEEDLDEEIGSEVIPMAQPAAPMVQQQLDPQVAQALTEQMRLIIGAQEPRDGDLVGVTNVRNAYTVMMDRRTREEERAEAAAEEALDDAAAGDEGFDGDMADTDGDGVLDTPAKVIVSAGNVSYGQLMNELNSDIPGPVLIHVLSGPLAGGRAIGKFEIKDEYLVLSFKRVVKGSTSYKVDAIAMDERTTLSGMNSKVDHHYMQRVVLPAAAEFIKAVAEAAAQTETSTTTGSGGATTTDTQKPSTNEQILKGVQKSADKVSEILTQKSTRPITVRLKKGTTMGILFMESVKDTDIEK